MSCHAENGVYTHEQAKCIPEALLHRYFLNGQGAHEGEIRPNLP